VAFPAPDFFDAVLFIHHDHNRLILLGFFLTEDCISHNDYHIPRLHTAGRGTIQTDDPGASLPRYHICLQPGAIVVVHHLHPLVRQDAGRLHQGFVYGDAAHIT
jgi:hypothetical protein